MSITTVLFDLDGTLLPMDQDVFVKEYLSRMCRKVAPAGYEPKGFVDTIWRSTAAMVKNDGSRTNETVFWEQASAVYGDRILRDKGLFDAFYREDFDKVRTVCGYDPAAAELVRGLKERGFRVILATNPLFPAQATQWRIRWAGLEPEDFDLYTTYENSSFCKPNPAYYRSILEQFRVPPEECLMVGNDVGEDMIAEQLGMKVFLLTDCLINKKNEDISRYPQGSFDALRAFLAAL